MSVSVTDRLMFKLVLILALIFRSGHAQYRVVNGDNAELGQFKFAGMLLIRAENNQTSSCSASLIDNSTILTAAHCVENKPTVIIALFGLVDWRSKSGMQRRVVKKYKIRDSYSSSGPTMNDIALLKVTRPFTFNQYVQPIRIWPQKVVLNRYEVGIVGFGKNSSDDYGVLRYAKERIVSFRGSAVCGDTGSHSVYGGDSGGPMIVKMKDGRTYQVGIASYMTIRFSEIHQKIDMEKLVKQYKEGKITRREFLKKYLPKFRRLYSQFCYERVDHHYTWIKTMIKSL